MPCHQGWSVVDVFKSKVRHVKAIMIENELQTMTSD